MKTLTSLALAGALAASAIGATATGADAGGWHRHGQYGPYPHPMYNYYYYGPDAGAAVAAGAIFGLLAAPLLLAPSYPVYPPAPPPLPYPRYAFNSHYEWCAGTYQSYDDRTDTWIDFQGVEHQCIDPSQ